MDRVIPAEEFDYTKIPLVRVQWRDHFSTPGWASVEEIRAATASTVCHTIAYLLKEDDEEVVVTSTLSEQGDGADPLTILKKVIISMEVISQRQLAPRKKRVAKQAKRVNIGVEVAPIEIV